MRTDHVLTYLHIDHLGSTVHETNVSGAMTTDQKYRAFGIQRDTGSVSTDHHFTGQKQDGSGLQYFNARYYDPSIGTFISPDTIVPNAGNVFDYNRFMYAHGNAMNVTDPSGHCASTHHDKDKGTYYRDGDEACWQMVDNILREWGKDRTGYWDNRWMSQDDFLKLIAPYAGNDQAFMQREIDMFYTDPGVKGKNRAIVKAYTMDKKSRADDPKQGGGDYGLCTLENDYCRTEILDGTATFGSGLVVASWACGPVAPECAFAGATLNRVATGAGMIYTLYNYTNDDASEADLLVTPLLAALGEAGSPEVGLVTSVMQFIWDHDLSKRDPWE